MRRRSARAGLGFLLAALVIGCGESESGPGRIAFSEFGQGDALNLFVMSSDGTGKKALAKGFAPTWSPDGLRLAFTRSSEFLSEESAIWTLAVDDPAKETRLLSEGFSQLDNPAWSPDGNTIAFTGQVELGENYDIFVMPAAGGAPRPLTRTEADEDHAAWSPDSTKIVYSRFGADVNRDSPDIWVMNADGSGKRALTRGPDYDYEPFWAPDGDRIAFQRQYPPFDGVTINDEIIVMNADGSGFRRLTNNDGPDDFEPCWSPDGERILFVSDRTGVPELYVMQADGSGLERLTDHSLDTGGDYGNPAWGRSP